MQRVKKFIMKLILPVLIIAVKDNIAILKLVANAMIQEERVESYNAINEHINDFQKMKLQQKGNIYPPEKVI